MSEELMLKCLIAFILGWLASRMMGNGFSVGIYCGGKSKQDEADKYCKTIEDTSDFRYNKLDYYCGSGEDGDGYECRYEYF